MNRTFRARITLGHYLFLLLTASMTVWTLWDKKILVAIVFIALFIIGAERLIHTLYTITHDGKLILYYGRFSKSKIIELRDIKSLERAKGDGSFGLFRMSCILIVSNDSNTVAVIPKDEIGFTETLMSRINRNTTTFVN